MPQLPDGLAPATATAALRGLLDGLLGESRAGRGALVLHADDAAVLARMSTADCIVYDCMDELANFRFAPPELLRLESELLAAADLVFTGGYSLYEAKRDRHADVHPFPSSVDVAAFRAGARSCAIPPTRRHCRAAARLLRRDRRADGPRPARRARRRAARLVDRDGRPGREDRPTPTCRAAPTSTISAARPMPSCPTICAAGTSR